MRRVLAVFLGALLAFLPSSAPADEVEPVFISGGSLIVMTTFGVAQRDTSIRWGVEVIVQIPFDRLAFHNDSHDMKESPMKSRRGWAVALPGALAIAGVARGKPNAEAPATSASFVPNVTSAIPSVIPSAVPLVVQALPPNAIRALVSAAWKAAGADRDEALTDLAARARLSALAPEVRLRAYRGIDSGARLYRAEESDRTTFSDGAQSFFEARLAWRLDRLVFADEEVAIERIRVERADLKQRISAKVLDLVLRFQRARRAANDADLLPHERDEAAIAAIESLIALDALTGGSATSILMRPTP